MDERTLRQMVEDHERRIANLEARLDAKTRTPAIARGKPEEKDPAGGLFDDLPKEIGQLEF